MTIEFSTWMSLISGLPTGPTREDDRKLFSSIIESSVSKFLENNFFFHKHFRFWFYVSGDALKAKLLLVKLNDQ